MAKKKEKKIGFKCASCGSEDVVKDAYAVWSEDDQEWVLDATYDNTDCNGCDSKDVSLEEYELED